MSKYQFIGNIGLYDFSNKEHSLNDYCSYMLNRTNRMFKYKNLPDIPQKIMELMIQTNGHVGFTKIDDKFYVFEGNFGDKPNEYYFPTKYIVANPALNLSKEYVIDKDIVIISNDTMFKGLIPLLRKYFTAIVETDLSIRVANISSRMASLISAGDDKTYKSAQKYVEDIEKGKLSVIAESAIHDGVRTNPYSTTTTNVFTNLIETRNYWLAELYEELGLNKLNNMKRESLNNDEINSSDDILTVLVNDMLECRREAVEKINEIFDLNIEVEFNSSWFDTFIENEIEHLKMLESISQPAEPETNTDIETDTDTETDTETETNVEPKDDTVQEIIETIETEILDEITDKEKEDNENETDTAETNE